MFRHDLREGHELGMAGALHVKSAPEATSEGGDQRHGGPCKAGGSVNLLTFKLAFVPLMPLPMIFPSCTNTQPTGVSSEASANSAMPMASRMNPS